MSCSTTSATRASACGPVSPSGRIASFKVPRHVRVVADVPRTPGPHGDKVQRVKLREMALTDFAGKETP